MKTAYENLKVGDKIKCIKIYNTNPKSDLVYYDKNKIYTIKNIRLDTVEILTNYGIGLIFTDRDNTPYDFNEYFISLKEERKIKLDKLNESRR